MMMVQGTLDFNAKVRHSDPLTSHKAADKMDASGKTKRDSEMCLEEVRHKPGQTAAEIALSLGIERHDPSRRLPELRNAGKVLNWHWNSEWPHVEGKKARERFTRICRVTGNKSMTWWPRY